MIWGLIDGLIIAFILSLFGFDDIVVGCLYEWFGVTVSSNSYYMLFAILGALSTLD